MSNVDIRRERIGTKLVDVSFIPFMRGRKIFFKAQGLRPNTRYFPYFGKKAIDDFTREETNFQTFSERQDDNSNVFSKATAHPDGSTNLISDANGIIIGSFVIPSSDNFKFRTGTREFKLVDVSGAGNDESNALSSARVPFTATGIIETYQDTVRVTRIQNITRRVTVAVDGDDKGDGNDPLAQTFSVDAVENKNGIFVTKIRVYFATKSSGIPVRCEIRSVRSGVPNNKPLPDAVKFLDPSEVNIPSDLTDIDNIRSNGTDFEFDEPVFLESNKDYAFVLLADTVDYTVFVAKTYDFVIGSTEARVNRQPTLGSLFLSQNGATWTPDQDRDMMFQIYRAEFVSSGTALFTNSTNIRELTNNNSMLTDSGGDQCTVFMSAHGFAKNDKVFVSGVTDADVSGAFSFATSVLGSRTITKVDHTGFTFDADSNAQGSLFVGGENMLVTRNMMYDGFVPTVQTLLPGADTTISASVKAVSGSSYAGTRNTGPTYAKEASYSSIVLNEPNYRTSPGIILNDSNITTHSVSGASFDMKLDLATSDPKVSPIIDLQRADLITRENIIDKQDVSATSGFNVPIDFIDETDALFGSHAAKHVTTPVTLEEPAVGLSIKFGANRPASAGFRVYFKTGTTDDVLDDLPYVEVSEKTNNPADEVASVFREYEFLAGGEVGNLDSFTQFQVKIVMTSTNSSQVPTITDLRVIALVT